MTEWWYRRAIYNEERQAYIVQHPDGSEVIYCFESLEPEENELHPKLAICNEWEDEDKGPMGERKSSACMAHLCWNSTDRKPTNKTIQ